MRKNELKKTEENEDEAARDTNFSGHGRLIFYGWGISFFNGEESSRAGR